VLNNVLVLTVAMCSRDEFYALSPAGCGTVETATEEEPMRPPGGLVSDEGAQNSHDHKPINKHI